MGRATWRRRRATRWRSTAEPTDLAMINPMRGPASSCGVRPRRKCTTRSGCTARIPYFTVVSNSVDRLMRLRADSTAENLTLLLGSQPATPLAPPTGNDRTSGAGTHPKPEAVHTGSAPVVRLEGPLALGHGILLVVCGIVFGNASGRSRMATRSVCGSVGVVLLLAGAVPMRNTCGSQPYRRRSGDCLRVLTTSPPVKPGLAQPSRPKR
jgi:hypothetical protein